MRQLGPFGVILPEVYGRTINLGHSLGYKPLGLQEVVGILAQHGQVMVECVWVGTMPWPCLPLQACQPPCNCRVALHSLGFGFNPPAIAHLFLAWRARFWTWMGLVVGAWGCGMPPPPPRLACGVIAGDEGLGKTGGQAPMCGQMRPPKNQVAGLGPGYEMMCSGVALDESWG